MGAVLNLDQFRNALQSGGLSTVSVKTTVSVFIVTAQPRTGDSVALATTRDKKVRGFRDAGKAIAVLHAMGARKFEVDTSKWSPEQAAEQGRCRPDTSERQRRAHQAADYDAWFRAEVEQVLREANDPATTWVSNEEANASWARWRVELMAETATMNGQNQTVVYRV